MTVHRIQVKREKSFRFWLACGVSSVVGGLLLWQIAVSNAGVKELLIRYLLFAGLVVSWNIVGGLAGQLSLGHAAFFGVGAYIAGVAVTQWSLSPEFAVALASLGTLLFALVITPAFRVQGVHLAILTLALVIVVRRVVATYGPGGNSGLFVDRIPAGSSRVLMYTYGLVVFALLLTAFIRRGGLGAGLTAIRDDQIAAELVGIRPVPMKLIALALSALIAGPTGALYVLNLGYIDPDTAFNLNRSVLPVLAAILGGLGTTLGPLIGSLVWFILDDYLLRVFEGAAASLMLMGGAIVLVVYFAPNGLMGAAHFFGRISQRRSRAGPDRRIGSKPAEPESEPAASGT